MDELNEKEEELRNSYLKSLEKDKKTILEIIAKPDDIILFKNQVALAYILGSYLEKRDSYAIDLIGELNAQTSAEFPHKRYKKKIIEDIQNYCSSILIKKINERITIIKNER